MTQMRLFALTLWIGLFAVYLVTGERLLDWVFEMPDIGAADDLLIAVADTADLSKSGLGLKDWFGEWRRILHTLTGLGG